MVGSICILYRYLYIYLKRSCMRMKWEVSIGAGRACLEEKYYIGGG